MLKDIDLTLQPETPTKPNPKCLKHAFLRVQLVYSEVSPHLAQVHVHHMQQVCCGKNYLAHSCRDAVAEGTASREEGQQLLPARGRRRQFLTGAPLGPLPLFGPWGGMSR